MARRAGPNMQPAVMTLTFSGLTAPAGGSVTKYLDLSQIASIVNRRFYRQGLNWAVAGFKILSSSGSQGIVSVSKLQNTWVTSAAWEKAFRHWQKQQREALDDAGLQSTKAKYADFKILMDTGHQAQYLSAGSLNLSNLIPDGFLTGEWDASQVVIPNDGGVAGNTGEYTIRMYGASDANSKGIVEGYVNSRALPQDPDPSRFSAATVASSWFSEMIDVGEIQEEVVDNALNNNNSLPYNRNGYPGAVGNNPGPQTHDTEYITGTTIGGTTRLKGGNFPCGLVKFQAINTAPAEDLAFTLYVDLVPGHHRGYLCESMVDM